MVTIKLRYWTKHISCEKPPNSLHSSSSASFYKSSSINPPKLSVFPHVPSSSNLFFIPPPPPPPPPFFLGGGTQHNKKGVGAFFPATEWFWHMMIGGTTPPVSEGGITWVPRLCSWTWGWRWRFWGRVRAWCSWSSQCRSVSAAGRPPRQSSADMQQTQQLWCDWTWASYLHHHHHSHTLGGLTSSLKTRAWSSQPIRFWTNLKTCNTNTSGFECTKAAKEREQTNMLVSGKVCSLLRHSMLPPGWRECPERQAAAYSAAPSTETESGPTDCSELTWTVTDTHPPRTCLRTNTQRSMI